MNTMTLKHFYDFYYLEAMRAGFVMAKSDNPAIEYKHSFEKLENDVNKYFDELTANMAERVRLYLWAASLGEARHAHSRCQYAIEEINGGDMSRKMVFKSANEYAIDSENIQALKDVFNQEWGGAYGGEKWLDIVEAIEMYGKVSNATFLDHAVDLEHNGGCIFDKSAGQYEPVNLNVGDLYSVKHFLDVKFETDILKQDYHRVYLTSKTYRLLERYNNVVSNVSLDNVYVKNEALEPFDVEFEFGELTVCDAISRISCADCGCSINEDDAEMNPDGDPICYSCYSENYTICDNCGKLEANDEIRDVDGENYCQSCAERMGAVVCEKCENWTMNYIITADENETICDDCKDEYTDYCEECNEHYNDIDYHNNEEHPREENEETQPEAQPKQDEPKTIIYTYNPNGKAIAGMTRDVEYMKLAGAIVLAEFDKQPMTFKVDNGRGIKYYTTQVTALDDYSLWVINLRDVDPESKDLYAVYTKAGQYFGTTPLYEKAVEVMWHVKDLVKWAEIDTLEKWYAIPMTEKLPIKKIITTITGG